MTQVYVSPRRDFYVNIETALRSAMSAAFALLWLGMGPFEGGLSFFTGATSIMCAGNSAGQVFDRFLVRWFVMVTVFCTRERPEKVFVCHSTLGRSLRPTVGQPPLVGRRDSDITKNMASFCFCGMWVPGHHP